MSSGAQTLRPEPFCPAVVLLTGASGYVGALIAARLLADGVARLVLPVRPGSEDRLAERLRLELTALGLDPSALHERIRPVTWPGSGVGKDAAWAAGLDAAGIEEVVHCAGCLDYFDADSLTAVNEHLTAHLTGLGRRWGVRRFTYVSTAYSAGYVDGEIPERLVPEPDRDPTQYTRSKRRAEWLVAESGLPWLVVRPAILIGEHATGRYSGKRYGLYQQWMGLERLMTDRYHPVIHTVAPSRPLNLMHQDFFQDAFAAAHAWLPDHSVCHLTSRDESVPTMRQLWDLWLEVVRPQRVYYYPRFEDVDLRAIDIRQRAYLTFAQVNLEIGAHPWRFAHGWLDALAGRGLAIRDATLASVARCQERFVAASDALGRYQERFADQFPHRISVQEVDRHVANVKP